MSKLIIFSIIAINAHAINNSKNYYTDKIFRRKLMKKLLTILLALTMIFTLAACGAEEAPAPATADEAPAATEEAPVAEEAPVEEATEETAEEEVAEEEYFSQDVTITNSTGVEIYELYITPSEQEDFGSDLLGESTFPADTSLEFTTDAVGTADATWDILIVDMEGTEVVFSGANFSASSIVDINMGADGATPTISMG